MAKKGGLNCGKKKNPFSQPWQRSISTDCLTPSLNPFSSHLHKAKHASINKTQSLCKSGFSWGHTYINKNVSQCEEHMATKATQFPCPVTSKEPFHPSPRTNPYHLLEENYSRMSPKCCNQFTISAAHTPADPHQCQQVYTDKSENKVMK